MTKDLFHQEKKISLKFERTVESGELNRVLRSLGFKLFYDVYGMERKDKSEDWQSETYMDIETLYSGELVDAQDNCNELFLVYPLATIDSSFIELFANLTGEIKNKLGGKLTFEGKEVSPNDIVDIFTGYVTELMNEWGEEPGSMSLSIMIEREYL